MTGKTMIYLVRHGETDWNIQKRMQGFTDIPLNNTGRNQARTLAQELQTISFSTIYSSPLLRAYETAQIIARHHKKTPLVTHPSLKERSFGKMEGKTQSEFDGMHPGLNWKTSWSYPYFRPPGGESLEDIYKRVHTFMQIILQNHHSQTIAIVSHGVTTRMIIASIMGIPIRHLGDYDTLNASLTILESSPVHGQSFHVTNYRPGK